MACPLELVDQDGGLASLEAQIHDISGGCEYYRVNGGMDPPPIEVELLGSR
jgi:hypothetical protein